MTDSNATHLAALERTPDRASVDGNYLAHGTAFEVSTDPCSWMCPLYGFQFSYKTIDDQAQGVLKPRGVAYADRSPGVVQNALETMLTPAPCGACGGPAFRDAGSNRKDRCGPCFLKELDADLAAEDAKRRAADARRDAKRKAKGYTHKTVIWIHAGGDDYSVEMHSVGEPAKDEILKVLNARNSRVLDDYRTTAL